MLRIVALAAAGLLAGAAASGQMASACRWEGEFSNGDLVGTYFYGMVSTVAVFDDGNGEELYAGGWFTSAGGVAANYIAKWDGKQWSQLSGPSGTGVAGPPGEVHVGTLAVYDDGSGATLFAGGYFFHAGGVRVNSIAKWNGTEWSPLTGPSGTGLDYWGASALAVHDDGTGDALYVAGRFNNAGGVAANGIAKWNGSTWSALPTTPGAGVISEWVYSLGVYDDGDGPELYAGGNFVTAGGVTVNSIAKWDGTSWSPLTGPFGTGVADGGVSALTVFDDGNGDALFVGGGFYTAGGIVANGIARWDGGGWLPLIGPSDTGVATERWVNDLGVYDDGAGDALFAVGRFSTAGGVTVNKVAKWNGVAWQALTGPAGTGVGLLATAMAGFGSALYVGGEISSAGGLPASNIARWICPLFGDGFESGTVAAWSDLWP